MRVLVAGRDLKREVNFMGARVIAIPGGIGLFPKNAATLTKNILAARAEVVHVFTGSSTLLGVFALLVARFTSSRSVISLFGREDFVLSGLAHRALFRIAISLARSIDVNSSATGSLLPVRARSKAHVLLGAAEEPKDLEKAQVRDSTSLLFVGRLAERKGVDDLLRAFARVRVSHPSTSLTIVGDGPERENLKMLAKELGVQHCVEFKGTLVGRSLEFEYAQCAAFVLPSKHVSSDTATEGLGLALIEAAMHRKPLIGTRHGGIPEVIRHGENGLLVTPGDSMALADAITAVLSDRVRAERMGEIAYQMARSQFGWEKATDVLLESYV